MAELTLKAFRKCWLTKVGGHFHFRCAFCWSTWKTKRRRAHSMSKSGANSGTTCCFGSINLTRLIEMVAVLLVSTNSWIWWLTTHPSKLSWTQSPYTACPESFSIDLITPGRSKLHRYLFTGHVPNVVFRTKALSFDEYVHATITLQRLFSAWEEKAGKGEKSATFTSDEFFIAIMKSLWNKIQAQKYSFPLPFERVRLLIKS